MFKHRFKQVSQVELEIPEGCEPGDTFTVEVDGQEMEIVVPEGRDAMC